MRFVESSISSNPRGVNSAPICALCACYLAFPALPPRSRRPGASWRLLFSRVPPDTFGASPLPLHCRRGRSSRLHAIAAASKCASDRVPSLDMIDLIWVLTVNSDVCRERTISFPVRPGIYTKSAGESAGRNEHRMRQKCIFPIPHGGAIIEAPQSCVAEMRPAGCMCGIRSHWEHDKNHYASSIGEQHNNKRRSLAEESAEARRRIIR